MNIYKPTGEKVENWPQWVKRVTNENVELNWENSEFKWITPKELKNYQTVPSLEKILVNLL